MFYLLSKKLDVAVEPVAWAIALALVAAVLVRSRPRASRAAALLAAAVLLVFSAPRTGDALMRAVERSAKRTWDPAVTYDAVVVLTGMVDLRATQATHQLQLSGAAERILTTWDLARTGHARTVFISGENEAEPLRAQLIAWGVPPDRVLFEGRSRNTHENAVETAKAVRQHGWRRVVLVTSAFHMERAMGCFRREGLEPDALPVDYRGSGGEGAGLLPREDALADSALAFHELLGRLVYRLVGYSA